jgi:hypothetical protein
MDHLEEIYIIYVLDVIWIQDGTTKFNDRQPNSTKTFIFGKANVLFFLSASQLLRD